MSKATATRTKTTPATEHNTVADPEVVVETVSTGESDSESSEDEDNGQFHDSHTFDETADNDAQTQENEQGTARAPDSRPGANRHE